MLCLCLSLVLFVCLLSYVLIDIDERTTRMASTDKDTAKACQDTRKLRSCGEIPYRDVDAYMYRRIVMLGREIYIYTYVYIHIHTYMCMCIGIYTYVLVWSCVYIYTLPHIEFS